MKYVSIIMYLVVKNSDYLTIIEWGSIIYAVLDRTS